MTYLKFKDFLSEALLIEDAESGPLRVNMAGNINDASKKGLRHLKNYVMPTLNKAQKKKVMANFDRVYETRQTQLPKLLLEIKDIIPTVIKK